MKIKYSFFIFCFIALFSFIQLKASLSYTLKLEGVQDPELESALKASSRLLGNSEKSAASFGVLKRRSEADLVNFVKVLHGLAYYNGRVEYNINQELSPINIVFTIHPGPIYPLASFKIVPVEEVGCGFDFQSIYLDQLGITLGAPAYALSILEAEETLLRIMAEGGYPNASIQKREVVADQKEKNINVTLEVDSGPRAYFGITKISGNSGVREEFFVKKIAWHEGDPFNLSAIKTTQESLEGSGLFNSTNIILGEIDPQTGLLPIDIQVNEAKHRSIGGGISYTTQRGVGGMAEWEHRNVRGFGEKINISTSVWKDTQDARFSYVLPDFQTNNRDLLLLAEVKHEDVEAYTETSFSTSAIIDKRYSDHFKLSRGLMYKSILTEHSDHNGNFHLLKFPLQVRWSTANNLLDPTSGYSINFKFTPTVQLKAPHFLYCPTTFIGTYYHPFTEDHRYVFAAKTIIGSIIGSSRHAIPPSERFYAGSENTLRGYKYLTVSPLNHKHDPIGGRSIMVLSLEGRIRISESFGVVGFYEIGNVYSSPVPEFNHRQLQSVGAGLRYHTPIGPIRLDVAVPLDRRKGVDNPVQVYMSIGQSF